MIGNSDGHGTGTAVAAAVPPASGPLHWHRRAFRITRSQVSTEDMAAAAENCRGCGMAAQLTGEDDIVRCAYGTYLVWNTIATTGKCERCRDLINVRVAATDSDTVRPRMFFVHVCTNVSHSTATLNIHGVCGIARCDCEQKTAHQSDIVTFFSKVLILTCNCTFNLVSYIFLFITGTLELPVHVCHAHAN